ncbi:hypothetical protein COT70_00130 [candidate division WWE3 bacterium CG09_land_8_20_14_0_10_47_33]|uniref:Mur ligase central domain-containing protein n=1 Tax=candidate division WWE3 bacterium CG_4_9_14_0_2_um_filter_48_10 TaxID=1975078 RepID=A0A2M8EJ78_UNCKA|nr:MAG: hypothetical protein COT70_00130 [candidate division WWE3 bacterium CG09_land_8_20_14_0_10_47_33]PIZ40975.1 MAG: hypothetical protein COY35_01330 [candidate division WWE3 bacterium CG_4_10_14_0_2_um_filter_47_8]PJC22775.1 MAG: hypothetical protein CO059_01630 [candidate division WWE3 bacterium CG_4_9_14_0_2_um_filter_48_10]PJE51397.1 MAG: hypothetical protein COV28_02465 [candidate division WWE3 bacterium CG10_big_fil_rev_8_21_14_0_10_48_23]
MVNPNFFRRILRRGLRRILAFLSQWALKKHKPQIVAVVGEGKTGIAREAIYRVLKSKYPIRRNVEAPDAEFVLPLIILGTTEYPRSYFGWIKILLKSFGQLLLRPAHKHLLVLEIGYSNKEIFDYFWALTHPSVLVICGDAPYLSRDQTAKKTIRIKETDNLKPYFEAATKVGKLFKIEKKEAERALAHFTLPPARIQIIPAKDGGLIVDASYQYYPPSERSLDEILEALPGRKILFTPETLQQEGKAYGVKVRKGEIGVILGQKKKMWKTFLELAKTPWFV